MSHTIKADLGTLFIHNGDYSEDVDVISVSWPDKITDPDGSERWSISVPFADMRQLVFAYLRDRQPTGPDCGLDFTDPQQLRQILEHAMAALADDNEGVRLWMLDCGDLVAKYRARAEVAEAKLARIAEECAPHPGAGGGLPGETIRANRILAIIDGEAAANAD